MTLKADRLYLGYDLDATTNAALQRKERRGQSAAEIAYRRWFGDREAAIRRARAGVATDADFSAYPGLFNSPRSGR